MEKGTVNEGVKKAQVQQNSYSKEKQKHANGANYKLRT